MFGKIKIKEVIDKNYEADERKGLKMHSTNNHKQILNRDRPYEANNAKTKTMHNQKTQTNKQAKNK